MKPVMLALSAALLTACTALAAEPVAYTAPDGVNAVPVTATTPLPVSPPAGAAATQVQGPAPTGAPPVGNPVLVGGTDGGSVRGVMVDEHGFLYAKPKIFSTSASAFVDLSGDGGAVYIEPIATAQSSVTTSRTNSTTIEYGHVIKAAAGNLYSCNMNSGSLSGWFLALDGTSIPADGLVSPVKFYQVAANNTIQVDFTGGGVPPRFSSGITVVFSTTGPFNLTKSPTAVFSCEYK